MLYKRDFRAQPPGKSSEKLATTERPRSTVNLGRVFPKLSDNYREIFRSDYSRPLKAARRKNVSLI